MYYCLSLSCRICDFEITLLGGVSVASEPQRFMRYSSWCVCVYCRFSSGQDHQDIVLASPGGIQEEFRPNAAAAIASGACRHLLRFCVMVFYRQSNKLTRCWMVPIHFQLQELCSDCMRTTDKGPSPRWCISNKLISLGQVLGCSLGRENFSQDCASSQKLLACGHLISACIKSSSVSKQNFQKLYPI
jgi:hypothetical protein